MSWLVWGLTAALLALPAYLAVVGVLADPPARLVLVPVAGLVALLYAGAWLYARPTRFEITPDALVIVWPARRRRIARAEIARARALRGREGIARAPHPCEDRLPSPRWPPEGRDVASAAGASRPGEVVDRGRGWGGLD